MKNYTIIPFLILFFSIITLSCKDDEVSPMPENKLEAKAGSDKEATINTLVTLDGSASKDGNNKPFTYLWSIKSKPATSAVALQQANTASPTFTPDVAGSYQIELRISQGQAIAADQVTVVATAPVPNVPVTGIISSNINKDTVLADIFTDPGKADYIITGNIEVLAKLTIMPGVLLEFESDKSLNITPEGALIAKGTAPDKVTFTGKTKTKGFWKGIILQSKNPLNQLDHAVIEYAGGGSLPGMPATLKASVALSGTNTSGAAISFTNTIIREGDGYGLFIQENSELNAFYENSFRNNAGSAMYLPADQAHKLDYFSQYNSNNGYNGVETSGRVSGSTAVTWPDLHDGTYFVRENLIIESGLRMAEGVTLEFAKDVYIEVKGQGYLTAIGTEQSPVTFTAHAKTGDNNWAGIVFRTNHQLNKLHYTEVSFAGSQALPENTLRSNISVLPLASISVKNSNVKNGLGWGIVVSSDALYNDDIATSNIYAHLPDGNIKLPVAVEPETTTIFGEWVDEWSLSQDKFSLADNFYVKSTGIWFGGKADAWHMDPQKGIGIKINEDGSYIWTIAQAHVGCISYSAEYITGNLTASATHITFVENYFRSKFFSSCNPDANVDAQVEHGTMTLKYEIYKSYNVWSGEGYWVLKFTNPDNSTFKFYKKI